MVSKTMYTMTGTIQSFSDYVEYNDYIVEHLSEMPSDLGALNTGRKRLVYALRRLRDYRRYAHENTMVLSRAQTNAWMRKRAHEIKAQRRRSAWLERKSRALQREAYPPYISLIHIGGDDLTFLLSDSRFPWESGGKFLNFVATDWAITEVPPLTLGRRHCLHLDAVLFLMSPFFSSSRTSLAAVERFVRTIYTHDLLDYSYLPRSLQRQGNGEDIPF